MAVIRKPAKSEPAAKAAAPAKPAPAAAPAVAASENAASSILVSPVEVLDAAAAQVEEIREFGRTFALQGVETFRSAYDRSRTAAEEAAASVETIYSSVTDGVRQLNLKAIDNFQANTLAFFELTRSIATAPGAAEAVAVASEHSRKQAEVLANQAKEYAELTRSVSEAALAPVTETFGKSLGLKAA